MGGWSNDSIDREESITGHFWQFLPPPPELGGLINYLHATQHLSMFSTIKKQSYILMCFRRKVFCNQRCENFVSC